MTTKNKRREVRLTSQDEDLLVEAAGLAGVSVSEFLLSKAIQDAEELVERHRNIDLDSDSYKRFLATLDQASSAPAELVMQLKKSRLLKHSD
ncbi:MAG: DUF1778 domain-containing protein [Actinomycetota bacterium]|nr:MAG: DUF1778 domain-containing protein [Actinomycetota bacterium]